MKEWLKKLAAVALSLLMVTCHAKVTGPALLDQDSDKALGVYLLMWLANVMVLGWALFYPLRKCARGSILH